MHFLQESCLLDHVDYSGIHACDMGHINTYESTDNRTMERDRYPADQCELTCRGSDAQQAKHLHIFIQHDRLHVLHVCLWHATLANDTAGQGTKADPSR